MFITGGFFVYLHLLYSLYIMLSLWGFMARQKEVFIGSFPKMGTTNFRGLLQDGPKVKKTNISKFKGKRSMSQKRTSQKDGSSKDYTSGIIWINTDSKKEKSPSKPKSLKKK